MSAALCARTGCLVAVAFSLAAVPAADAAPLRLDARFGDGGIVRVPLKLWNPGGELTGALRPVRQPDGKVLVPARVERYAGSYSFEQVALARFTRRGAVDKTFGRRGRVLIGFHWGSPVSFSPVTVSVQADGRILLAGRASGFLSPRAQLAIVRLLPNGARDPAFGTNGVVLWNPPYRGNTRFLQANPGLLLRQPDGRLLVPLFIDELASSGTNVSLWRFAFGRFNENGSVDESFGRSGVIEGPDGRDYFFYWVALADGDIAALASRPEASGPHSWRLHRFTRDGALDREFGQDGSVRLDLTDLYDVSELVPMRDGGLVIVRATALRRVDPTGQLDARFGTTCGRLPVRTARSVGAAATSDGGILGTVRTYPPRTDSFIVRYGSGGCPTARVRLGSLSAGPPLVRGRHTALVGATYERGLALVRIRR